MRLGVITDEVTQDFREALEFAKEFGLDCVDAANHPFAGLEG